MWILEQFFPELLALVQRLASKTDKRIHVRGQWDNATPHVEKMLLRLIVELFGQYGWEWTTQPANTPLANAGDAAIFPAFAKDVALLGGMTNGGQYLQCEQLWETLQKAWDNHPAGAGPDGRHAATEVRRAGHAGA